MLREIYYAFIHSHVLYGVEIYANSKPTYLDKLMKLNNKLLRILQCKPITTPIRKLYKTYNTLLITDLHKQQLLLFFHKFIHHPELLPDIFINNKFFTFNDEIHKYNTRITSNIHLYQSTTSVGLRSVSHKAAVLWNELPLTLKRMTSSTVFKRNIKISFVTLLKLYMYLF